MGEEEERWGSCLVCHVFGRGETLSEGTLSALMEWLASPRGRTEGWGGGQKDLHIWNHFRSAQALAVKGETGRLAGERGRQGSDTGHTTVRDQRSGKQQETERP